MNVSIQVRGHLLQNKSHCGVYRHSAESRLPDSVENL